MSEPLPRQSTSCPFPPVQTFSDVVNNTILDDGEPDQPFHFSTPPHINTYTQTPITIDSNSEAPGVASLTPRIFIASTEVELSHGWDDK